MWFWTRFFLGFPLLVSPHVNLSTSARNVSILSLPDHGKNRWLSGLSGDIWSDHWATHHATLTAICLCQHLDVRAGAEGTSHCLRPTSARCQLEQDDLKLDLGTWSWQDTPSNPKATRPSTELSKRTMIKPWRIKSSAELAMGVYIRY
jgi:hypothetical protein